MLVYISKRLKYCSVLVLMSKEQRISVLFSGRISDFEKNYYLADFKQHIEYKNNVKVDFFSSAGTERESFDIFNRKYDTAQMLFSTIQVPEYFKEFPRGEHSTNDRTYYNLTSQHYHNKVAFNLMEEYGKKNNIEYIAVVKFRSDIKTDKYLPVLTNLSKNTVYTPNIYQNNGVNDMIAYGDFEAMKKYCCLYDNIETHIRNGAAMHPESLLLFHLRYFNLEIKEFDFNYKFILHDYETKNTKSAFNVFNIVLKNYDFSKRNISNIDLSSEKDLTALFVEVIEEEIQKTPELRESLDKYLLKFETNQKT